MASQYHNDELSLFQVIASDFNSDAAVSVALFRESRSRFVTSSGEERSTIVKEVDFDSTPSNGDISSARPCHNHMKQNTRGSLSDKANFGYCHCWRLS